MASMNPELELMIFMTPIFTDRAKLALEVFKGGTFCVCGWSANLESKLLAVFCSLRRLLLATLLFEISFNWRIIRDFGIT